MKAMISYSSLDQQTKYNINRAAGKAANTGLRFFLVQMVELFKTMIRVGIDVFKHITG